MKKNPIHLVIPMSGQGTRYQKAGYKEPKPLIPVNGRSMIARLLENIPERWPTHFILADNHKDSDLPAALKEIRPSAKQTHIPAHKKGPSFALLSVIDQLPEDAPVLVSYCDYAMVWDHAQFERFVESSECDACIIAYQGFHAHYMTPVKYAYCRMNGEKVAEIREKHFFTDNRENEFASSGGYYFKSARLLREAIEWQMKNDLELNGEYYTSLTVEALIRMNPSSHIRVFEIPGFFQWGTPEDLKTFEYWEQTYNSMNRFIGFERESVDQIILPMAGLGSRFAPLTDLRKPMIPISGAPMYHRALESTPKAQNTVIVTLNELADDIERTRVDEDQRLVRLKDTPPGQALTTEAGLPECSTSGDIIVTACDHAIVLDPKKWAKFRKSPDCDAAIFTVRNYPGCINKPKSFSYVQPADGLEEFPLVERVWVKTPFTNTPHKDPLLVGTFWFKDKSTLEKGIKWLKDNQIKVNNELYLDSVFTGLKEMGQTVRMIELDGYINWGDPESLREALYWQEIFLGHQLSPRRRYPGSLS